MMKYAYHIYYECKKDGVEISSFYLTYYKVDNKINYNKLIEYIKKESSLSEDPFIKSLTFLHEVEEKENN